MADSAFPHGRRYYTKSGYFHYLDDATIDLMVEAVATIPSAETAIELPIWAARRRRWPRTKPHSAIAALPSS